MRVIDTGYRRPVRGLAFTADGSRVAVGIECGPVTVFDLTGSAPLTLPGTEHGQRLASCGGSVLASTPDGMAEFDPATGVRRALLPRERPGMAKCQTAAGAAAGRRLVTFEIAASRRDPHRLVGWGAGAGGWEKAWAVDHVLSTGFEFSAAGDCFAHVGCRAGGRWQYELLFRSSATGELLAAGVYDYETLSPPRVRPDGRQVAAAVDAVVLVWDAARGGKPVAIRNDTRRHFTAAAYHPGGRHLFTTSNDATVTVWDTTEWVRVRRFDWEIGRLRAVAVSPDGQLAAAGSDRGTVVVWDVDL